MNSHNAITVLRERLEFHQLQAAKLNHKVACYAACLIDLGADPASLETDRPFRETDCPFGATNRALPETIDAPALPAPKRGGRRKSPAKAKPARALPLAARPRGKRLAAGGTKQPETPQPDDQTGAGVESKTAGAREGSLRHRLIESIPELPQPFRAADAAGKLPGADQKLVSSELARLARLNVLEKPGYGLYQVAGWKP